jgi:hypothetical protein
MYLQTANRNSRRSFLKAVGGRSGTRPRDGARHRRPRRVGAARHDRITGGARNAGQSGPVNMPRPQARPTPGVPTTPTGVGSPRGASGRISLPCLRTRRSSGFTSRRARLAPRHSGERDGV